MVLVAAPALAPETVPEEIPDPAPKPVPAPTAAPAPAPAPTPAPAPALALAPKPTPCVPSSSAAGAESGESAVISLSWVGVTEWRTDRFTRRRGEVGTGLNGGNSSPPLAAGGDTDWGVEGTAINGSSTNICTLVPCDENMRTSTRRWSLRVSRRRTNTSATYTAVHSRDNGSARSFCRHAVTSATSVKFRVRHDSSWRWSAGGAAATPAPNACSYAWRCTAKSLAGTTTAHCPATPAEPPASTPASMHACTASWTDTTWCGAA